MAFPQDFLDEIRGRVGLAATVGRRVKLTKRGREWSGLCPFHNEKTPSFTVNEQKGFFHCFGCGAHGSLFDFVMQSEGLEFRDAVAQLAAQAGLEMPRDDPREREQAARRDRLRAALEDAAAWFAAQLAGAGGREAAAYLRRRGVDEALAARFGLGYAPRDGAALLQAMQARGHEQAALVEAGLLVLPEEGGREPYARFRDRVMFPIGDRRGGIVGFGGRAMADGAGPKYLNSPETPLFHKGRTLFNHAAARDAAHRTGQLILVEGYMDVIGLSRAGIEHAVAPLGTALTEEQMAEAWRLAPEPVVCFDGDTAGERAMARAAERALPALRPGHSLRFVTLPAGEDPDSLTARGGASAFEALLRQAVPLAEVLWRNAAAARRLNTPEQRAALAADLDELAGGIRNETVRAFYRQSFQERLAKAFGPGLAARQRQSRRFPGPARPEQRGRERWRREAEAAWTARRYAIPEDGGGVRQHQELVLLAVLLHHPALLEEVFEELASLPFADSGLDSIRGTLLKHATEAEPLDTTAINAILSDAVLRRAEAALGKGGLKSLEPALWPDADLAKARDAWHRQARLLRLRDMPRELAAAEDDYSRAPDEASHTRLRATQETIRAETAAAGELPEKA